MSDTPRTDAAVVSAEYIRREMDYYEHKFILADHARQLERELTAALKDAERYRWLREEEDTIYPYAQVLVRRGVRFSNVLDGEGLDAAIDAAMTKEKS